MAAETSIPVKLLVMDRHFLYLPLYVAQFDDPSSGKRPWFGKIPPKYSVEVTPPPRESDRQDKAVFDLLMDAQLGSSDVMFAACDPTVLLARPDKNAMMAAALITSSAFWAVNHDAGNVRLVSDLASFDRILCYGPGTTSNLIARRIAKREIHKLQVVRTTDEIPQLEKLGVGTLALSPEVLQIANLVFGDLRPGEKRAKIVLELSTSKEFSNVLTTVLFTRADVIENHPELVSGILAAIQSSLLAIHGEHPIVRKAAEFNFRDPHKLDEAIAIARGGNVFPETIHVRHDRWQRACEFYYISQAMADGRDKSALNKTEQLTAEDLYTRAVQDSSLRKLVADAITRGFREALDTGDTSSATARTARMRSYALLGILLVGFLAGIVLTSTEALLRVKVTMGVSWILALLAGWWVGEVVGYRKSSAGYVLHWVSFVLSWWALHELGMPRLVHGAHFLPRVELSDAFAGGILTVTAAWIITSGFLIRGQLSHWSKNGATR